MDANHHLFRTRLQIGRLLQLQYFRSAELVHAYGFHDVLLQEWSQFLGLSVPRDLGSRIVCVRLIATSKDGGRSANIPVA